ncbi:MAG: hypothetical protein LAT68_00535 [Cyclobacteriaceae bacterium]|nr:hypothetical protein [Cyclobacteriaceae bacterium]MCH8514789.1 hypothetical protein [Cyclobacteriaceae bacterium]
MNKKLNSLIRELANDDSYEEYLTDKNLLKFFPDGFFTIDTEQKRLEAWENIKVKLKEIEKFNKVANPYYIGFGNPDSDLLIIGQEKAFNAFANPELMLFESINNSFQWSKIIKNAEFDIKFDPRNPREYHKEGRKGNHTWSKYSILADAFYDINSCHDSTTRKWNKNMVNTLFDKAFTTEINVTPAVSNSGLKLINQRKKLLNHPFFRDFKMVVFAIGNPEEGKNAQMKVSEIYNGINFEVVSIGKYGKDKDRNVAIASFENQFIVICNQLSGSSGWKNEHIVALGEKLRELSNINSE